MRYFLTTVFSMCVAMIATAQQITINLPYFAGKEYVWFIVNGNKADTIAHGALDLKGQTVLTVPPAYVNWQGMSNFLLTDGGGLKLILNGDKNFTAGCTVEHPTINDIYYTGSEENRFLPEQYRKQQDLLYKASAIAASLQAYTPDKPFYEALLSEKQTLENSFAVLQRQIAESPLYAARFLQISGFCNGLGSRLDLTEKELIEEQRQYVSEVLDFRHLWNSGMWNPLFDRWMSLETAQGDSILLTDSKAIFAREQDRDMLATLSKKMVSLFHQYGKEALLAQLFNTEDLLSPGHQAPELSLSDSVSIKPLNSLVFFYETGCGSCENDLMQLRGNYPILKEKNIRVISVSADTDEAVYKKTADTFPWEQKLCDYKGFEGVNFKNYAVVGTPTIYAIDGNGTITGRYSSLVDYLK